MTISSSTRIAGPYVGNGVTAAFPFAFKVFAATDMYVVRLDTATGVETVLVLNSDYTVTLNADQNASPGGTITLPAALASGYTLTITSNVPLTQATDLTNQGGFYPRVITNALDRLTILCQQLYDAVSRSLKVSVSTPAGVTTTLPPPAANKLIAWNATADNLQNLDPVTLASVVAYGTTNADKFSGDGATTQFALSANPGALNNLSVSIGGVVQRPGIDYAWASGTTITFTSAPPSGTNNVLVRYMQGLPQGVTDSSASTYTPSGTGAVTTNVQAKLREFKSVADYLPVGYVTDGTVDYTAQIQAAIDTNPYLEFPVGTFRHGRLILKYHGQTLRGKGRGYTVLFCPSGYGITNFSGADTAAIGNDWVGGPTFEKMTLRGGFAHTDNFNPPANSWAVMNGRGKPFTSANINAGLRLKRCYPYTLNEVNIENFHRGVYASAAALGRWSNFEVSDCQYGMYGENGSSWGDPAWQVTTHRWSNGQFKNCWVGIGGSDFVQCHVDKKTVDFEPCNTGIAVTNGGDNVWSGYFELCSEGIYRNGGSMGHDVIEDPFFAGAPGSFWGGGDSILLDSGIGINGKVTLRNGLGQINGGGVRVLGGRLVQPEREKVGATVFLSPALTPSGGYTPTDLSWALVSTSDDVLGLYSAGAPTRLTIPSALSGARVKLKANLSIAGDATANDVLIVFKKNGASFAGKGQFAGVFAWGQTISMESSVVTVTAGDYFTVNVMMNLSRTLQTGDQCWLSLEVLE